MLLFRSFCLYLSVQQQPQTSSKRHCTILGRWLLPGEQFWERGLAVPFRRDAGCLAFVFMAFSSMCGPLRPGLPVSRATWVRWGKGEGVRSGMFVGVEGWLEVLPCGSEAVLWPEAREGYRLTHLPVYPSLPEGMAYFIECGKLLKGLPGRVNLWSSQI